MESSQLLFPGLLLLLLLPAVSVLAAAAATDLPAARSPGCKTRCGDIDVPYPFGLDPQCAIHAGFLLNCTTVDGATKLFHSNLEVIRFSVPDGKAWLKTFVSRQCYNQTANEMIYNNVWINLTHTIYVLSAADNKVIVMGCNVLAYMLGDSYTIGCMSECNKAIPKNGSCSGAGCCQVDLPKRIRYYHSYFNENYNTSSQIWRTTPCNYIAAMESAAFNFNTRYLTSTVFYDRDDSRAPAVMAWGITPNTCEEAKIDKNTPYACVSNNSTCVNGEAGYHCRCSNGYNGNPYIIDGCTDINECDRPQDYGCFGDCTNTDGGFKCPCPRGTQGNPKLPGGCVPIPARGASKGLIIAIAVGCAAGSVFLFLGVIFLIRRFKHMREIKLKQKYFKQNRGQLLQQLVSHNADIAERMIISMDELAKATNNFDKARELGGGGHGTVYKGILSDQHVVAIKKPKTTVQEEIDEFINEVAILSQINHRNVVKLFGCCLETEVPLLVYEFISNGTLYHHLHVEGPRSLPWVSRLRIATETSSALTYLHSSVSTPIIHRDIKSSNILLDDALTSKVADFGASRYIPIDKTGLTTRVQGTIGYLDPMYFYTWRLTEKSDVYSFGVFLVELLTRKKPFSYLSSDGDGLVSHFVNLLDKENLGQILDPQVIEEGGKEVEEVAMLAASCIKLTGEERPTMQQVELALKSLEVSKKDMLTEKTEENGIGGQRMEESSRRYSLEQEFLLSARYPR